jgi:hypothetical protein
MSLIKLIYAHKRCFYFAISMQPVACTCTYCNASYTKCSSDTQYCSNCLRRITYSNGTGTLYYMRGDNSPGFINSSFLKGLNYKEAAFLHTHGGHRGLIDTTMKPKTNYTSL